MRLNYILFRVKVSGESMWPRLVPGKTYWASSFCRARPGAIAVFYDKVRGSHVVKRIIAKRNQNFLLAGTVSWSSSYEIPATKILGCIFSSSPSD